MSDDVRASVAHHEAGHVAGVLHYGYRFFHVTLDPTNHGWMHAPINTFDLEKRAVIALCGPIAQAAYLGRKLQMENGDAQIVAHSLASIKTPHRPARDVIVARANSIVTRRWAMITRSAQALLNARGGRLSYDEWARIDAPVARAATLKVAPDTDGGAGWASPRWEAYRG